MNEFQRLIEIMSRLRNPENGCPWDLKQTESSLRDYIIEEAYELIQAIETGSPEEIMEELGDLLLQVVFISQIQKEKGRFRIEDVVEKINQKLIRRHPHIFSDARADRPEDVKRNWERIKMAEKRKKSILTEYPDEMPALLTAGRISSQAASVGFDWKEAGQALEKVREEIDELEGEIERGECDRIEQEIGDLLFAVANVSRLLEVNPEFALRRTNKKFIRRFRFIEKSLKERGRTPGESNLEEMDNLWNEAKKKE